MILQSISKAALFLAALAALPILCNAGQDGITPSDGTYTLHRTDPAPPADVATGKFSGGDPNSMLLNPGPSEQGWEQEENGQYYPQPHDGRSLCFHDGGTVTYEYKYLGDVISSGELQP